LELLASASANAVPGSDPERILEGALESAREMLGMDMAYVADMRKGLEDYREVTGDGDSFGARAGESIPLEGTYCEALLDGRLGNVVSDAADNAITRELAITADGDIGSYIGVPLCFSDGRVYGTFCCLSHAPNPSLQDRDVRFMKVLGNLIVGQIEREERSSRAWRTAVAAGSVQALLAALEARDGYTQAHSQAVVVLAMEVGSRLGLDEEQLADLEWVALLHDIGKIGISDSILRKPGSLTDSEWEQMRRHPEIGERIIASMPPLAHLAPMYRAGHERWDGGGYPDGLAGEQIPLNSRIVLVCDAYHAMTSDRPYRKALSQQDARAEISKHAGTQFCPASATALLAST
jgi:HD-GYP domain-containing protein (c-di-GMP phosphodiesterase class II)